MGNQNKNWVFLRGLARESAHWEPFLTQFKLEVPHKSVKCLDLPGAGNKINSRVPSKVSDYPAILKKEYIKDDGETVFVGISMGGMVVLEWAKQFPKDFEAMVIINSSERGTSPFYHRLQPRNLPEYLKLFFNHDCTKRESIILKMTSNRHGHSKKILTHWLSIQSKRPIKWKSMLIQLLAASRYKFRNGCEDKKTLVLVSKGDRIVHPSCSLALAKQISNSVIYSHPTAGHDIFLDEPDWVISMIKKWT